MSCTYCHQVGTLGFRTPEEPVDWEVMITRMDGFGALHKDLKKTIVKQLVELHGGSILAESDGPGRGSRFTIELPAMNAAANAGEMEASA